MAGHKRDGLFPARSSQLVICANPNLRHNSRLHHSNLAENWTRPDRRGNEILSQRSDLGRSAQKMRSETAGDRFDCAALILNWNWVELSVRRCARGRHSKKIYGRDLNNSIKSKEKKELKLSFKLICFRNFFASRGEGFCIESCEVVEWRSRVQIFVAFQSFTWLSIEESQKNNKRPDFNNKRRKRSHPPQSRGRGLPQITAAAFFRQRTLPKTT